MLIKPRSARFRRITFMADNTALIEQLEGLTVLELNSLVKNLEERWGVSAAAPVAVGVAGWRGGRWCRRR